MKKWHISEDGVVRECRAETSDRCPALGPDGEESPHFVDKDEGEVFKEEMMKTQYGAFSTLSKDSPVSDKSQYIEEVDETWEMIYDERLLDFTHEIEIQNCTNNYSEYPDDWTTVMEVMEDSELAGGNCSVVSSAMSEESPKLRYFEVGFETASHASNYYTTEDGVIMVVDFTARQYDPEIKVPLIMELEEWKSLINDSVKRKYGDSIQEVRI